MSFTYSDTKKSASFTTSSGEISSSYGSVRSGEVASTFATFNPQELTTTNTQARLHKSASFSAEALFNLNLSLIGWEGMDWQNIEDQATKWEESG